MRSNHRSYKTTDKQKKTYDTKTQIERIKNTDKQKQPMVQKHR